jgi:hypothetical protein
MQQAQQAVRLVSVNGRGQDSSCDRNPVVLEDIADDRLWRARLGIPGIYVVDRESNDSVFFEVQSYFRRDSGRRIIKVLPVSNWVDGECALRAREIQKGEWPQFLPSCVLFGKLDFDRLPGEHYDYLADWADLVLDAVERYNRLNPPRERQSCPRRDH